MSIKSTLKAVVLWSLRYSHILPSIWQIRSPFKIQEFREVMRCAQPERNDRALDLGCGGGLQTQLLAKQMREVIGIDLSPESITKAQQNLRGSKVRGRVHFHCQALQDLRLPTASLDAVFSFCVLEHIPELETVLMEVRRLLKPGGRLQVSVDSLSTIEDSALISKHRQDHFVHQYFTIASLKEQLIRAGLEVVQIFPILTGPVARREFERRILQQNIGWSLVQRLRLYRQIRSEDRAASGDKGIMLVAYARRS